MQWQLHGHDDGDGAMSRHFGELGEQQLAAKIQLEHMVGLLVGVVPLVGMGQLLPPLA